MAPPPGPGAYAAAALYVTEQIPESWPRRSPEGLPWISYELSADGSTWQPVDPQTAAAAPPAVLFDPPYLRRAVRVDAPGLILMAIGFLSLQLFLDQGERNEWFESSVAGLHFVGGLAGRTFGPICRFVAGAHISAQRVARRAAELN